MRIEPATDFEVTLTVRATTTVSFAEMERERPVDLTDAVENAVGSTFAFDLLKDEGFSLTIEGEAREI